MKNETRSTTVATGTNGEHSGSDARPSHLVVFLQLLAGASAVIGGITYAIVRIALNHFYSAFGVTPEEVGWNATAVLTRFALPFAILVLGALFLVVRFQEDKLMRTGSLFSLFGTGWSRLSFPVIVIVGAVVLVLFAHEKVNALRRGVPLAASNDSMVPISAPCVNAFWIDIPDARATLLGFDAQHKFFLLGEAGGRSVLYDPTIDAALRVPTSRIILKNCGR